MEDTVDACRSRNVGFAVVARSNEQIHAAISRVAYDSAAWQPAVRQDGQPRPGAAVIEVTGLVDLSDWPPGTRLIIRREPLHPGAQQSLFPSECYRYWGHYTDNADVDPVEADRHMRAHAHVEDNIRRLKDSAASRFPFSDFDANSAWLAIVCMADSLVRWFQQLCLTGPLAVAEPKTLRWSLWHTPARVVRRWPSSPEAVPSRKVDELREDGARCGPAARVLSDVAGVRCGLARRRGRRGSGCRRVRRR